MKREAPFEKIEQRLARLRDPRHPHTVVVCMGKDCLHAGSKRLASMLDGAGKGVRVVKTECLGCCSIAPAVGQDEHLMGCVSTSRLKFEMERLAEADKRSHATA